MKVRALALAFCFCLFWGALIYILFVLVESFVVVHRGTQTVSAFPISFGGKGFCICIY